MVFENGRLFNSNPNPSQGRFESRPGFLGGGSSSKGVMENSCRVQQPFFTFSIPKVTTVVLEVQLIWFRVPAANIDKGNMILAVPQLVDYEVGRPSEVTMLDNISRVKQIVEMGGSSL